MVGVRARFVAGARVSGLVIAAATLLLIGTGCRTSIGVPTLASASFDHAIDGVPSAERAHVWVSYQVTIDAIDGAQTSFLPPGECLYYRVTLPAGKHTFDLRLNYATATHTVHTDAPQSLAVELAPGESYRLVNLNAGTSSFQPWLQPGAPPAETIELR
ncbi:MAG: hypothetical protein ACI8PQ_001180 [Planctomycetota bacterium]|jgi:hypothetical protein